ncbi:MAG TPA: hypothetical protein VN176_09570 [Verrucomicrobiae bacterium]|nr:hypothetical protein [Verrucomicrobiae bacterium]
MFIAYGARDLLDAHICLRKEIGRALHPVFREQSSQTQASMPFEKVLQVGLTQVALESQVINLTGRIGFDHAQNLAQTALFNQ